MIKPEEIPQYTGNLELLEKAHGDLKTDAGHIRDTGADVHSHFQGLSAYYKAPEAERLFASTKPVKDRADGFADGLGTVSTALSEYATEIRPLVTKLTQLKTKATTFVNDNKDDDDWEYDEDKVDEHNQLRDDITATVAAFWAAERTCHNKITALFGGTQMVAGDGSKAKNQYGFNADDLKNAKLPWGDPVEEKHHVWEVGHWVKSFVWDGIIVDGVWGTIKGLGTLVGVDGWDAAGQAWKGLAQLGTGLAISAIPGAREAFWGLPDDKLPSWFRDSRTAMKQTGKALVAWDEWGKNPGRAAGAVTFNVVTTVFTGGAGGAAAGAGKAGAVAKALSVAGKAGRVIDPMTYVAKGAGAGLSKIGDITKGLKGIGNVDIPKLPEGTVTLPEGSLLSPDGTVHPPGTPVAEGAIKIPEGSVKLPDGGPVLPPDTIKLPGEGAPRYMDTEGNIYKADGTLDNDVRQAPPDTVDRPANPTTGADSPRVDTPARDPALVGAGARTADNAEHVVRLGDSADDLGRVGDDTPSTPHTGDNLPGGRAGDHLPTGHVGDNLPGGRAGDHLPGGTAHAPDHGPSASHESPTGGNHGDGPNNGGHSSGPHEPAHTHPGHEGAAPNNHWDDGAHHTHENSHEPQTGGHADGSSDGQQPHSPHGADGTFDRIQVGSDPVPPPGPGEKLLGDLPEERVSRTEDGLISHVDDQPVTEFLDGLSRERALDYLEAKERKVFPRGQTGACVGSVIDLRTGKVIEGINGPRDALIPMDRLHPTLKERYDLIADAPPHRAPPLAHAEVKAANELLWARRELGLPDDAAALSEMRASVQFPFMSDMTTGVRPRPAPFCGNCNHMLDGVPSSYGRYIKDPPGPENWIP